MLLRLGSKPCGSSEESKANGVQYGRLARTGWSVYEQNAALREDLLEVYAMLAPHRGEIFHFNLKDFHEESSVLVYAQSSRIMAKYRKSSSLGGSPSSSM